MKTPKAQLHSAINLVNASDPDRELTKEEELNDLRKLTGSRYDLLKADAKSQISRIGDLFDWFYSEDPRPERAVELIEAMHEVAIGALSDLKRIEIFSKHLSEPVRQADGWGQEYGR